MKPSLVELDVSSRESIEQARDAVKMEHGRLDVLINNAAVLFKVQS